MLLRGPLTTIQRRLFAGLAEAGFGDVRPSHGCVFGYIEPDGSGITALAARAGLSKPTLVYAVDDLERRGYVERVRDPADRRAKVVRLTARGRAVREAGMRVIEDVEAEWAALVGPESWDALRRGLEALFAALSAGAASAAEPAAPADAGAGITPDAAVYQSPAVT